MKIERVKLLASAAGVALLAACGGGGGDDTSGGGDVETGGLIPDGFAGDPDAGTVFIARVEELAGLLSAEPGPLGTLPTSGSATYSGAGVIVDLEIPGSIDNVSDAQGFALVATDAEAEIFFKDGDFTARQFDFKDAGDAAVAGEVNYSGTVNPDGSTGTTTSVVGSIAGTTFSTDGNTSFVDPDGNTVAGGSASLVNVNNQNVFLGVFFAEGDASGGAHDGVQLGGAFAADED